MVGVLGTAPPAPPGPRTASWISTGDRAFVDPPGRVLGCPARRCARFSGVHGSVQVRPTSLTRYDVSHLSVSPHRFVRNEIYDPGSTETENGTRPSGGRALPRCCLPRVRAMARAMRSLGMDPFGFGLPGPTRAVHYLGRLGCGVLVGVWPMRALGGTAAAPCALLPRRDRCHGGAGGGLAALRGAGGLVHRAAVHRPGWLWRGIRGRSWSAPATVALSAAWRTAPDRLFGCPH